MFCFTYECDLGQVVANADIPVLLIASIILIIIIVFFFSWSVANMTWCLNESFVSTL